MRGNSVDQMSSGPHISAILSLRGYWRPAIVFGAMLMGCLFQAPDLSAQSAEMTRSYQRGSSLYEAGMYEAAAPYFEQALRLSEEEFGADSSRTGFILKNLATVYTRLGRFAEAEPLYQRALIIFEQTFGPENGLVSELVNDLSIVYVEQKKFIQAEPLLERIMRNLETVFGPNDSRVAIAAYNYGYASEFLGDTHKARGQYVRALQIWQSQATPDEARIASAKERLAALGRSNERKGPSLAPYLPRLLPGQTLPAAGPAKPETPTIVVDNSGVQPSTGATSGGKSWRIQLAAFQSRDAAEREIVRLKKAQGEILSEAGTLTIIEAALEKGTYYRVGSGPLQGKEAATSLCNALKERQQSCIVVFR
jgi:tetratricopeptide (TPR) repeat protein